MITTLSKNETVQIIKGPDGKLELIVAKVSEKERGAWGIVCHPHPLYEGTMHNKVVTTLAKTFQGLGVNTIRFNFRGVGKSEGKYDQGRGEVFDLLAVLDWALSERPQHTIWLAGFSFGAYIAAKAATQIPVERLVTVAPPVTDFPMDDLGPITAPWILAQGEKDEIIPADAVFAWAKARDPQPIVLKFPEATHFFHGQLGELRLRLEESLKGIGG